VRKGTVFCIWVLLLLLGTIMNVGREKWRIGDLYLSGNEMNRAVRYGCLGWLRSWHSVSLSVFQSSSILGKDREWETNGEWNELVYTVYFCGHQVPLCPFVF